MRFTYVISNPPYNRGMDLDFIKLGHEISEKFSLMITPAKWLTAEDEQIVSSKITYGELRRQLVKHIDTLCYYPCCKDVFDILQVDGIVYFLLDKTRHDKCRVINKCSINKHFNSEEYRNIVDRASLFNIGNEIVEYIKKIGKFNRFEFEHIEGKRYQVWTNIQVPGGGLSTAKSKTHFVGVSQIIENGICGHVSDASICSFESDNYSECESFISWLNTRFVRFFVGINPSKLTGIICNDTFRFVSKNKEFKWDHIYTDKELYEYYELPERYISVIESIVKDRNS